MKLPRTRLAIDARVKVQQPGDYFILHRRISDSFQECALDTIASHMQLALWDPHIYLKLANRVTALVGETDNDTINFYGA